MQSDKVKGNVLIVIEHYGLVPAVNVSVRMSGTCGVQQIAVAVKSKQLFIELYRGFILHRQIVLASRYDMFVPSSCTNLCGSGIDLLLSCSKLHDFVLKIVPVEPGDQIPILAENLPGTDASPKVELDEDYPLEFSFRIQSCSNPFAINNGCIVNMESSPKGNTPEDFINTLYNADVEENVPYSVCCASCKQTLSQSPATFKKIVLLPSNWAEVAESWFCHVHSGDDVPSSSSLRTDELYVTEVCYLLDKCTLDGAFCEPKSHVLKCDTCYAVIGSTKQAIQHFKGEVAHCFKDMVVFKSTPQPSVLCDSLSKSQKAVLFTSALMRKNMEASFTCKFCFESKKSSSEGMCLFLWILDRRIRRFHFQKDLSTTVKCREDVKTEETLKVLYNSAEQSSPLARTWLHDFSVDVYEISDSMMKSLLEALQQSSKTVLRSQKMLNGLFVGFLPI